MVGSQISKKSRWGAALAALLLCSWLSADEAFARKRRRKQRKPAASKVNAKALGELMGSFKFGMTKNQVLKVLAQELRERYREKIKEARGVYEQDRLRRQRKKELERIKDSFVEFKGAKTGWDVSIIDEQFGRNSGESMMVMWENTGGKNQRRFFFFYEGQLYKMFIALDSSMLKEHQRSFAFFKRLMEGRYGPGKVVYSKNRKGEERPTMIDWSSRNHHVQAIDKLSFYGSFCLVVADPDIEGIVQSARDANRRAKKPNRIINSMLEGEDDVPSLDSNKAAVEALIKDE